MTDQELLKAAAKAEGHDVWFDESGLSFFDSKYTGLLWNPLHHDGDAFRLMIKLDLSSLMIFDHSGGKRRELWTPNSGYDGGKGATTEQEYATDPFAATRRAIVTAAANLSFSLSKEHP